MESMTDCAFSWPISARGRRTNVSSASFEGTKVWAEAEALSGFWGRTLVIVDDVAEVVAPAVVSLPHAHRVVRQVDVAVIA